MRVMKVRSAWLLVGVIAVFAMGPGCKPKKPRMKIVIVEGTVEKIERSSKRVHFRFLHKKLGNYTTDNAQVDKDTEILINGKLSKLEDVKEGDTAEVTLQWPRDKKDERTILKVKINRAVPKEGPPASKPAEAK